MNLNELIPLITNEVTTDWAHTQLHLKLPQQHQLHLISDIGKHIVRGKHLRPLLVLAVGNILGTCHASHHLLAAIVEIIHCATLLHDDVIDDAPKRHNQPTAWFEHGNKASILVGDYFFAQAFRWIAALKDPLVIHDLAQATQIIVAGEVQQHQVRNKLDMDAGTYFSIIQAKTAELFKQACHLSAKVSNASPEVTQACLSFGQALGLAFQLQDDLLDYTSDVSGKTLGQDWLDRKTTYPLIMAYQNQSFTALIESAHKDQASVAEITALLEQSGAFELTRQKISEYVDQANEALDTLPSHHLTDLLTQLVKTLEHRVY